MAVALFVPFPPENSIKQLPSMTREEALNAWTKLSRYYLAMDQKAFRRFAPVNPSLIPFLVSYAKVAANAEDPPLVGKDMILLLRHQCFCLTHRLFTESDAPPAALLEWTFLGDFSTIFSASKPLRPLLYAAWNKYKLDNDPSMLKSKRTLLSILDESRPEQNSELNTCLRRIAGLLKACPDYGRFLIVGSEFPDAIAAAWYRGNNDIRNKLTTVLYRSLLSLLDGDKPNVPLLLDHLYALKANTDKVLAANPTFTLLSHLVSSTSFIRILQAHLKGSDAARAESLVSYLEGLKSGEAKPKRRKIHKGKSRGHDEYGHGAMAEIHVHKMSLVTQIQELFPDLGSGFIVKLLDEYHEDPEQVTAHLLDDSLPPNLKNADRQETLGHPTQANNLDHAPRLEPRPTPPLLPVRKNIFDNDAFDNLTISPSNIHIGRKNPNLTASDLLADSYPRANKAAIMSALAALDPDDDERDDTYDVEDVGGTVDTAIPGSDEVDADLRDRNEEALFSAYKMSPEVFERNVATRRGKARMAMKSEMEMTDEAIEGWAIMLARDPRRLRRLEAKFSMAAGGQRELASTAYREGAVESGTEGEEDGTRNGGRGGLRSRARGRGRGRGRGDVAGPADDRATQVARQRKDANKSSRANHNRRDQRARKVARAGFPG